MKQTDSDAFNATLIAVQNMCERIRDLWSYTDAIKEGQDDFRFIVLLDFATNEGLFELPKPPTHAYDYDETRVAYEIDDCIALYTEAELAEENAADAYSWVSLDEIAEHGLEDDCMAIDTLFALVDYALHKYRTTVLDEVDAETLHDAFAAIASESDDGFEDDDFE